MNINKTMEEWKSLNIKLLLKLDYEDIIGNKYGIKFWMLLEPAIINYEKNNIEYTLKLEKIN